MFQISRMIEIRQDRMYKKVTVLNQLTPNLGRSALSNGNYPPAVRVNQKTLAVSSILWLRAPFERKISTKEL